MELIKHKKFSEKKLNEIKSKVQSIDQLRSSSLCVFTTGSYGRLEASYNSDIDLFFIDTDSNKRTSNLDQTLINAEIIKICRELDLPEFSKDGLYLQAHSLDDIKNNLGSNIDDFHNYFTARMLLILESKHIYNKSLHDKCLDELIGSYYIDFHDHTKDFKPLFLTNDIIRFWKTLCLNYEHRRKRKSVTGQIKPREKNVAHSKNLKLKFSRKLTCFSFILKLVALGGTVRVEDTIQIARMTPLERLTSIKDSKKNVSNQVDEALELYQWFINHTQVPSEDMLEWISDKTERDNAFDKSREFGRRIYSILEEIDEQQILQSLVI